MKKNLIGFLGFLIVTAFNVSIAVIFYSQIEYKKDYQIALLMLVVIILNALWCSIFDFFRRKIMDDKPIEEILFATEQMAKGDFDIKLVPKHSYPNYDNFDLIKDYINEMAVELSRNEVLKSDFIANISHEIKTPIAIIQNYAKVLREASLDSIEREKYLINLESACKKLNSLVMNILKLNKLENQNLSLDITRFNLSELLTEQILQFEELISNKNINLECHIEEGLYIDSEADYLEIVFNNIISNSIKFTEENGTITISLVNIDKQYIISFRDTGCGMDSDTGKHIFDKFYQGDTSHSKEGNGLGLTLVKKVIDIIGGTIYVESELGKGTTFTIVIKEKQNE